LTGLIRRSHGMLDFIALGMNIFFFMISQATWSKKLQVNGWEQCCEG
jgi:hypothetical protein